MDSNEKAKDDNGDDRLVQLFSKIDFSKYYEIAIL